MTAPAKPEILSRVPEATFSSAAANRHVLITRISALGTGPVSADYLDKHQLRGISLEHIRRDRILQEALATGGDPLHLALVFNIDHTNTMAYANAARHLLNSPAGQALLPVARPLGLLKFERLAGLVLS